ncbi:tRNA glutamyl-Q(34) synthetase GluQRS [Woodsholea maritima]|uniref:tRNA glutamyl-Q(34) synthetase GluQRS n=1 Tax=Woodsholea maritima TaxID=240237 RepID=UPI00037308ED|nr:tRNA glutamyl-Q(34) synthetase GluQRS [Woodsholea maritima]
MSPLRTRFAPSPTGYLHIGHSFAADQVRQTATRLGAQCLLRIENIDTVRCLPEFDAALIEDLRWIGFTWDGEIRRQSAHFDVYHQSLEALAAKGLVYRCFKTRKDIAEDIARAPHHPGEGPEGTIYPGPTTPISKEEEAERLAQGEAFAWRLSMRAARDYLGTAFDALSFEETGGGPEGEIGTLPARADQLGDVILGRKDVGTSYHLACTHDDHHQAISHIVRGRDLFFATGLHRLLQTLMGWDQPIYHHHRLLLDKDGKRFAKRERSLTLRSLREGGASAQDVRAYWR